MDYCARIISKKICAYILNERKHFFLVYSFYLVDSIFNSFSRQKRDFIHLHLQAVKLLLSALRTVFPFNMTTQRLNLLLSRVLDRHKSSNLTCKRHLYKSHCFNNKYLHFSIDLDIIQIATQIILTEIFTKLKC